MDKQASVEASGVAGLPGVNWKDYMQLTKPGILRSNLIAAFGGFWLASQWHIHWLTLLYMLVGTTLVMAASCVFNNYLDRDFDRMMERTSHRALPSGRIQPVQVLRFGAVLGVVGLVILAAAVNWLSALLGFIGMFVYVIVYTFWLKRRSPLSTVMGSFSGAMPPIIGYCAVTGRMDIGAWILFAILFVWQPPHFWALGIRRTEEYRSAGFRILPVVKGVWRTKLQMVPYVAFLIPLAYLLYAHGYVGSIYLLVSLLMGLVWLGLCVYGFRAKNDKSWAMSNFIFSINYLMITFLVMVLNTTHAH